MIISKLKLPGRPVVINDQVVAFLRGGRAVAMSDNAAICYTDDAGWYDVFRAKYTTAAGVRIKSWVKTTVGDPMTWKAAIKKYNRTNKPC